MKKSPKNVKNVFNIRLDRHEVIAIVDALNFTKKNGKDVNDFDYEALEHDLLMVLAGVL